MPLIIKLVKHEYIYSYLIDVYPQIFTVLYLYYIYTNHSFLIVRMKKMRIFNNTKEERPKLICMTTVWNQWKSQCTSVSSDVKFKDKDNAFSLLVSKIESDIKNSISNQNYNFSLPQYISNLEKYKKTNMLGGFKNNEYNKKIDELILMLKNDFPSAIKINRGLINCDGQHLHDILINPQCIDETIFTKELIRLIKLCDPNCEKILKITEKIPNLIKFNEIYSQTIMDAEQNNYSLAKFCSDHTLSFSQNKVEFDHLFINIHMQHMEPNDLKDLIVKSPALINTVLFQKKLFSLIRVNAKQCDEILDLAIKNQLITFKHVCQQGKFDTKDIASNLTIQKFCLQYALSRNKLKTDNLLKLAMVVNDGSVIRKLFEQGRCGVNDLKKIEEKYFGCIADLIINNKKLYDSLTEDQITQALANYKESNEIALIEKIILEPSFHKTHNPFNFICSIAYDKPEIIHKYLDKFFPFETLSSIKDRIFLNELTKLISNSNNVKYAMELMTNHYDQLDGPIISRFLTIPNIADIALNEVKYKEKLTNRQILKALYYTNDISQHIKLVFEKPDDLSQNPTDLYNIANKYAKNIDIESNQFKAFINHFLETYFVKNQCLLNEIEKLVDFIHSYCKVIDPLLLYNSIIQISKRTNLDSEKLLDFCLKSDEIAKKIINNVDIASGLNGVQLCRLAAHNPSLIDPILIYTNKIQPIDICIQLEDNEVDHYINHFLLNPSITPKLTTNNIAKMLKNNMIHHLLKNDALIQCLKMNNSKEFNESIRNIFLKVKGGYQCICSNLELVKLIPIRDVYYRLFQDSTLLNNILSNKSPTSSYIMSEVIGKLSSFEIASLIIKNKDEFENKSILSEKFNYKLEKDDLLRIDKQSTFIPQQQESSTSISAKSYLRHPIQAVPQSQLIKKHSDYLNNDGVCAGLVCDWISSHIQNKNDYHHSYELKLKKALEDSKLPERGFLYRINHFYAKGNDYAYRTNGLIECSIKPGDTGQFYNLSLKLINILIDPSNQHPYLFLSLPGHAIGLLVKESPGGQKKILLYDPNKKEESFDFSKPLSEVVKTLADLLKEYDDLSRKDSDNAQASKTIRAENFKPDFYANDPAHKGMRP